MFAATAAAETLHKLLLNESSQSSMDATGAAIIAEGYDVIVFEGTSKTLSKVRISGGGRCNVMHDITKPLSHILASYPRGQKELRGTYTKRFTPTDAYDWFTTRGVSLKTEEDGRMFPITNDSITIIDCITHAALIAGVKIRIKEKVECVEWQDSSVDNNDDGEGRFAITLSSRTSNNNASSSSGKVERVERFDAVILATGSFPMGHEIAKSLGHTIVKPVPSLFTLDTHDLVKDGGIFNGLSGVAVPWARLTLVINDSGVELSTSDDNIISDAVLVDNEADKTTIKKGIRRKKKSSTIISQEGPLLITHHGVSGPAALRLSAFAAREFHELTYQCDVQVHFCPKWEDEQKSIKSGVGNENALMNALWEMKSLMPKRRVSTGCPLFIKGMENPSNNDDGDSPKNLPIIPKRLWSALVQHSNIPSDLIWGDASKSMIRSLTNNLSAFPLRVTSKGIFKEEFVTAGGVNLNEVQMSNMQSKLTPGLFMCGEVLDVDGVTGGFNFMGCWSTGYVAGQGAAQFCLEEQLVDVIR
jgi:predicted flavoprotein YhiN